MYNKHKYNILEDILDSTSDRVIIFYNYTEERERIIKILKDRPYSIIAGDIKDLKNYEFAPDSVTLIQYQTGSMGLNLQKANKIIYFSMCDKAGYYMQSKKRIHRIGQSNTCFYYYLVSGIEKDILEVVKRGEDYTLELFARTEDI